MQNFESKELGRIFESIWFVSKISSQPTTIGGTMANTKAKSGKPGLSKSNISIEPALYVAYRWKVPDVNSNDCLIMILDKDNSSLRSVNSGPFTIDFPNSVEKENYPVKDFALFQNYPNPFNPVTNIEYSIAENPSSKISEQYVY